jgi:hypothetical protein
MSRLATAILIAASLVACVGQRPLENNQPCPCAPGWSCDYLQNVCVADAVIDAGLDSVGGSAALRAYSADELQTALAQCELPHGPVASSPTYGAKRAFMLGAWIGCPPSVPSVFSPAIVFLSNGTWQHLLSDGNGGLVIGYGVENQGTYQFPWPDTESTATQAGTENPYVDVRAATSGWGATDYCSCALTLESSPSRIHVEIGLWLVRLPIQ